MNKEKHKKNEQVVLNVMNRSPPTLKQQPRCGGAVLEQFIHMTNSKANDMIFACVGFIYWDT